MGLMPLWTHGPHVLISCFSSSSATPSLPKKKLNFRKPSWFCLFTFSFELGFLSQFDCLISSSLRSVWHKMARRRVKRTVKESAPSNQENQPQIEEPKHFPLIDQEGTLFQVFSSFHFFLLNKHYLILGFLLRITNLFFFVSSSNYSYLWRE